MATCVHVQITAVCRHRGLPLCVQVQTASTVMQAMLHAPLVLELRMHWPNGTCTVHSTRPLRGSEISLCKITPPSAAVLNSRADTSQPTCAEPCILHVHNEGLLLVQLTHIRPTVSGTGCEATRASRSSLLTTAPVGCQISPRTTARGRA